MKQITKEKNAIPYNFFLSARKSERNARTHTHTQKGEVKYSIN